MSGATSIRSRTLPLTWTTIVTRLRARQIGVERRPRLGVHHRPLPVPALPRLGGDVGRHRGEQQEQGVGGGVIGRPVRAARARHG